MAFSGDRLFVGNFNGFNIYDIEKPRKPKLLASVVCPGGQGDVSVYGNLLFMSVEQTRGRIDCGTQGVADAGEHRAVPRRAHLRHLATSANRSRSRPYRRAAARTRTRSSPIRTTRPTSTSTDPAPSSVRSGRGAGRLLRPASRRRIRTRRCSASTSSRCRSPRPTRRASSAVRASSPIAKTGNIAGLWQGGNHGPGRRRTRVTNQCHDITVFPEIGLAAGACSGNGILLDISRPREPGQARRRLGQELRVLAFGDVQQRRHEGALHRRVGRRPAAALPGDRSAELGRRRDLRHRRPEAALRGLLQDAGGTDRHRELRRAQRLAHSRAGPRHHGPGLVPGRRLGVRFHRPGASDRDRVLRSRPDRREEADDSAATGPPTGTTARSTGPRSPAGSTSSS